MPPLEKCLCPKEVAVVLGVSEKTVRRLMQKGEIAAFRLHGKLWRTTPSKISEYQSRQFQHGCRPRGSGSAVIS